MEEEEGEDVTDYAAIIADVLAAEREEAERQGEDVDSKPREPASDDAIAEAERVRERTFSDSYRAFLKTCDGWEYFSWGIQLFGTAELSGEDYEDVEETREYDEDITDELQAALIIGRNENDATLIMLCENGNVVDHLYEESERWPDLAAYLRSRIDSLKQMQRWAGEAVARTQREWDPGFRAEDDAALVADLRKAWRAGELRTHDLSAHRVEGAETPAATELIANDDEGELSVALDLGLVLFLGFAPTEDEVLQTFRAFREAFPFEGSFRWQPADAMVFSSNLETDPSAEPFELAIDDQGFYGLRITVGDDDEEDGLGSYILNIRGIPPEAVEDEDEEEEDEDQDEDEEDDVEYQRRASFVEVLVPPGEDPAKLRALCERLTDILPVRSGWGGWFARVRDRDAEPEPWNVVFEWCRRYFHVAPCYLDGWLAGALTRAPGVGWLTILGRPFLDAIELTLPAGIERHDGAHGSVFTAGELTLGDVHAGDFPAALSALAQQLESVSATSWSKHGNLTMGGIWFSTHATELPGDFADHHATEPYMRRFVNPEGLLGPTPREEALALVERVKQAMSKEQLAKYEEATDDEIDGFHDVLQALFSVAYFVSEGSGKVSMGDRAVSEERDDLAIQALELAARYPDWASPQIYNNLLVAYDRRDRIDDAMAMLDLALKTGEEGPNSYTFHSAACLLVKAGRLDEAMRCVQRAAHHEYPLMDKLEADEDLEALRSRKEWKALFGSPS